MFGYSDQNQDFIVEYNGIILAFLVSWTMKSEKCGDLVAEIAEIMQIDMVNMFKNAFLPIYLHLHLNTEEEEIRQKGMELLLKNAESTLYALLKLDYEVSENELIFY